MGYYSEKLSGHRLRECYEIAPPRVRQYLESEIDFLLGRLGPGDSILELGCGYGRATLRFAAVARRVVGIDTSRESLELARELARERGGAASRCEFLEMDATDLKFPDHEFDLVACIQNGICAFRVDQMRLVREALRVTRPGGRVYFSTYSERFWPHRLRWFELQAEQGLVGAIDHEATGNGVIVCKDGFRAGALGQDEFAPLCAGTGITPTFIEVDGSSLFCELIVPGSP